MSITKPGTLRKFKTLSAAIALERVKTGARF